MPLSWVMLAALGALIYMVLTSSATPGMKISWPQLMTYAKEQKLAGKVEINDSQAIAKLKPGSVPGVTDDKNPTTVTVLLDPRAMDTVYAELRKEGIDYDVNVGSSVVGQIFITIIGPLLLFGGLIFFLSRSMRGAGGGPGGMLGSFGKSRHRVQTKESVNVTFSDVAGIDEAKEEVTELVEFLKNPKRFQKLGGRIPRGVLLEGPPGCGKTLLAKAIAGEADVPFFSISGSDFVEMFVGVGASRVRDLFKQAKENSPCIIFLDEIDAVGRRRGGGFTTGGHDEREQTLNAILVEMDGFNTTDGVIVIAATNRNDVLDPALTRQDVDAVTAVQTVVAHAAVDHIASVVAGQTVIKRVACEVRIARGVDRRVFHVDRQGIVDGLHDHDRIHIGRGAEVVDHIARAVDAVGVVARATRH